MSDRKVIPFRKRAPTTNGLQVYRWITRRWSPELRQLMLPDYFAHDTGTQLGHDERGKR